MYDEQPVRDNYGALIIIFEEVPEVFLDRVEQNFKDPLVKQKLMEINKIGNILDVSQDESKPIMLAFHVYKTSKAYGITFIPFSINLSRDIRLYISQLKNKTYLFGKSAMSNFVSKMLYAAGTSPTRLRVFHSKGAAIVIIAPDHPDRRLQAIGPLRRFHPRSPRCGGNALLGVSAQQQTGKYRRSRFTGVFDRWSFGERRNKGHYVDSVTNMITLKISCLKGILIDKGHYV